MAGDRAADADPAGSIASALIGFVNLLHFWYVGPNVVCSAAYCDFFAGFYFFDFPRPKVMANLFQMRQKAMCA